MPLKINHSEISFLIQNTASYEAKTVIARSLVNDFKVINARDDYRSIVDARKEEIASGLLIPVGSVEFIRDVAYQVGIKELGSFNLVPRLGWAYNRQIFKMTKREFLDRYQNRQVFVKSYTVKLFDGFIFNEPEKDGFYLEQIEKLTNLSDDTLLLVSNVVYMASEWRCYVLNHHLIGMVRYDQKNSQNVLKPDLNFIHSCIECFSDSDKAPSAYALDIAVLESTKGLINPLHSSILVEVNDAWALGLYAALKNKDKYLEMLISRWREIILESKYAEVLYA